MMSVRSAFAVTLMGLGVFAPAVFAQDDESDSLERDYKNDLPRIAPTEPADVAGTFSIDPNYRIDLVAAEPLVYDPIAMAFDEQARMFVVEMRGYSERRDMNIGAVRLLTDTDGDGVYDTSTVYADGLMWPTAVACYDGGIFVAAPPSIYYFKDTDGDGKSDIKEEVYTGFGLGNVQGLLNSFNWSLDGRINGATSTSGGTVTTVGDPNAMGVAVRGRDFAFNPTTRKFEATSGGAQHGMTYDMDGHKFICHNSNQMIQVMYDDHYIARNPYIAALSPKRDASVEGAQADVFRVSPVEPWRVIRTRLRVKGLVAGPTEGGKPSGFFTSATGITVYKGDAWPEEARGQIIVADVGSNLVHRKNVTTDGLKVTGQRIDEGKEFIASTDNWFRPVQFANAPDGSLVIADMYREVIEHPASLPELIKKYIDLNAGFDRGRIYRVVPTDFVQPKLPNLGEADTATLVGLLEHDNAWHFETAMRLLFERQPADAVAPLQALAHAGATEHGRMRALYALASLGAITESDVLHGLNDASPLVRRHAIKISEPLLADNRELIISVLKLQYDPEIEVLYQLAFTLGEVPLADKAQEGLVGVVAITMLENTHYEPWMELAVLSSVRPMAHWMVGTLTHPENKFTKENESKRQVFLGKLAMFAGTLGTAESVGAIIESAEQVALNDPKVAENLVRGLIDGLQKVPNSAGSQDILAKSDIAKFIVDTMKANALVTAGDEKQKEADRIAAIKTLTLSSYSEVGAALLPLLGGTTSGIQLATLSALRAYDDPAIAEAVLGNWPGYTTTVRAAALELLFSKTASLSLLLDAVEKGDFAKTNITSNRVSYLQKHSDAAIAARAKELFVVQTPEGLIKKFEEYQPALQLKGDVVKGRAEFEARCAQCHKVYDLGYGLGPDLATMANRGAESILVNVIDPNREINPQFVVYNVETKNGDMLSGVLHSETSTSITLKRAGGIQDNILRNNIEDMYSSDLSIMPEGLEEGLSVQGMADLITFLMESGQKEN